MCNILGKSLHAVLLDLYGAGSGTTAATLAWLILYLLKHPEIQDRLHKELDEVTGGGVRDPCLDDRQR
jgi:cytochrome P450